jgi:uncharacterized protein YjbI with pentapeptide repeats
MTNTNQDRERTKSRITYAATPEGIKSAEAKLNNGFASKKIFADLVPISRSTVTKFFAGKPIELDGFLQICNKLKLDWKEIAGIKSCVDNGEIEQELNSDEEEKVTFTITSSVGKKDIAKLKSIIRLTQKLAKDNLIDAIDIEEGSIKVTLKGSQSGLKRLEKLFQSGELTKIFKRELNITVEDVSFIDAKSFENHQKNQNRKLLAFTIAGDVNRADINILKAALTDTSDDRQKNIDNTIQESKTKSEVFHISIALIFASLIRGNLFNVFKIISNSNRINLSGANLSDINLSGANLSDINLSGADLSGAFLSGAFLSGANLSGADLSGADLRDARMGEANLSRANLSDANLILADLSEVNLRGADLSGADLSEVNLRDANLRGANLSLADLRDARLSLANLSGAFLSGADLNNAKLSDVNLSGANLSGADLRDANLSDVNLRGANLSDVNLRGANLIGANVEKAHFSDSLGISESLKQDLIKRGAIFEDSPGDRSEVFT